MPHFAHQSLYQDMEDFDNPSLPEEEQREIWQEIVDDYNRDHYLQITLQRAISGYRDWQYVTKIQG